MLIDKKRIREIKPYLAYVPRGAELKVVVSVDRGMKARLAAAGFENDPSDGDTLLPNSVGSVSDFNANGVYVVHKDRKKEPRYVGSRVWRWTDWGDNEHEKIVDMIRDCYPRTFIEPPSLEVSYVEATGGSYVAINATFTNEPEKHEAIRHAVNLALELFGSCEIVRKDLSKYAPAKIKRVNWHMLPPGKYPWAVLRMHLEKTLREHSEDEAKVIADRQSYVLAMQPSEINVGLGGFAGYIAYVFKDKGLVVLESVAWGNALYVFGEDWKKVSQLTKAEVLQEGRHVARVIHSEGWKVRLHRVLNKSRAA